MTNIPVTFGSAGVALWAGLILLLKFPPDWVNLASSPVLLILASSLYSLVLPLSLSLLLSGLAVLMFNYEMVPPVNTLHVDLHEHGMLLVTMMVVSALVSYLLRRQKQLAGLERLQAQRTLQLMQWSETLRESDDPHLLLPKLHQLVLQQSGGAGRFVLGFQKPEYPENEMLVMVQQEGFAACLKENQPLGCNTGRYDTLDDLYLPMRGRFRAYGACLCIGSSGLPAEEEWVSPVQALLDQMGQACERWENLLRMQSERESAQNQKTRSLFLTSIAHDQRTPLASIMTCASALLEQGGRLSAEQVRQHAELIYAEAGQALRLTDNTLTLARLSGEGVSVPMQEESAEDIVSAVLQRLRQRNTAQIPGVKVEPGLPLLKCNMMLVEQVLDNLLDNAARHSGAPGTVELTVSRAGAQVCFLVTDRGKGFEAAALAAGSPAAGGDHARGLGIGLQLCRAVAAVHAGTLEVSTLQPSGSCILFCLPLQAPRS